MRWGRRCVGWPVGRNILAIMRTSDDVLNVDATAVRAGDHAPTVFEPVSIHNLFDELGDLVVCWRRAVSQELGESRATFVGSRGGDLRGFFRDLIFEFVEFSLQHDHGIELAFGVLDDTSARACE